MTMQENRIVVSSLQADGEARQLVHNHIRSHGLSFAHSEVQGIDLDSIKLSTRLEMTASDLLVILVSPSLLQSQWATEELQAIADEWRWRDITVILVKVQPCRIPSYMANWIVVDAARDFDRAMVGLVKLLELIPIVDLAKLDPRDFEKFVGDLLRAYQFTEVTQTSMIRDQGFDYTATFRERDPFGRTIAVRWLVETKAQRKTTDISALRSILGQAMLHNEPVRVLFVTNSQLTSAAQEWLAQNEVSGGRFLSVLDRTDLKRLLVRKPNLIKKYFGADTGGPHV